ncbi:hypothetical protein NMY22_g12826 [Coprinellus aureogranulatus]|nr:hypothetical protein NMY22_g12826 [Coprinellus aureogranulatus]
MLFKPALIAAALAALVSGSAVNLEARQGELATCTIRTTPSSTPNPTSGLLEEFTTIFIREYAADLPSGTSILTGSTSFTGPSGGAYTVTRTTGAVGFTAEQTRNILRAWAGQTFSGGGQVGVGSWHIDSVTC